ncbi:MAG TPA: hypothetical protein DCS43_03315 [Verrucomicrobia bacterium]|nr:hypothetical protein [Verrucomicrobiota bacterium]
MTRTDKKQVTVQRGKRSEPAVIQLKLRELNQLFNSMDPSPFINKDLDADAEAFIAGWALEFPVSKPIKLLVHVDQTTPAITGDMDPQTFVESSIQNFFLAKARTAQRDMRNLLQTGQISLLIGVAFMVICLTLSQLIAKKLPDSTTAGWFREGLSVGCWVALWKPIDIYLYGWWPLLRRLRIFRKMSCLTVQLKLKADTAASDTTG